MAEGATAAPSSDHAARLLAALVREGVAHVVVAPGSRSQALALAAVELERLGRLRLHVRVDERVAGFLALGVGVETGMPAVVITTSGSAPAHLHPAVLEADAAGVPLIVVSADRPAELRGIRANQTTVQPGLFARAVRWEADVAAPDGSDADPDARALARDAVAAALGTTTGTPGPVHLNVQLRDPLSGALPDLEALLDEPDTVVTPPAPAATTVAGSPSAPSDPARVPSARAGAGPTSVSALAAARGELSLPPGGATIVIAGADAGEGAEALARAGGWPLVAEVSSGARFGPQLVVAYRELLADPAFGGGIRRAVVLGHPTLSREVPALLVRDDVETIVVAPTGAEAYDPGHDARVVAAVAVDGAPSADDEREVRRWVVAARRLVDSSADGAPGAELAGSADRVSYARAELAAVRARITRGMLVDAVWQHSWPGDRLVVGASRLIRELDRVAPGRRIRVHASRGLAGIDGTIATALGIALSQDAEQGGVVRVLLGDLALLHDAGSLAFGEGEERPRLRVVVGDDGGGTIFDTLEVAATAPPAAFRRVLRTPQAVDVAALAAAYGWEYARASTWGELESGLAAAVSGPSILHVALAR